MGHFWIGFIIGLMLRPIAAAAIIMLADLSQRRAQALIELTRRYDYRTNTMRPAAR